ncbi:MAG TPA: 16S rRNA (uracil(1498)-N(3))-methyltransferase [Spongiibacteraceae bacterium]|nr:16S rRNA (uracil(1498)-N(3))-methyltransferase [Spongiibacteraceae bacterium]
MNLILLEPQDYTAPNRAYLRTAQENSSTNDERAQHIREVLQAKAGDNIKVGNVNGLLGTAEILTIDANGVALHVTLTQSPPAKLPLTLILALPRPKVLRRILRSVAELGVRELILLNTYKVEKSYWQSPALAPERIREYFIEGLQQSRDSVLPIIRCEKRFKPFVEDQLPAIIDTTIAFVAHPGDDIAACPLALNQACTLAVGPEGGFIPYEVEKLRQAGLEQIQLGERILRVENAMTTLIARLFT